MVTSHGTYHKSWYTMWSVAVPKRSTRWRGSRWVRPSGASSSVGCQVMTDLVAFLLACYSVFFHDSHKMLINPSNRFSNFYHFVLWVIASGFLNMLSFDLRLHHNVPQRRSGWQSLACYAFVCHLHRVALFHIWGFCQHKIMEWFADEL